MTPAGTSNELDVQNGWEENTHTHCGTTKYYCIMEELMLLVLILYSLLLLQQHNNSLPLEVDAPKVEGLDTLPLEVDAPKV